MAPPSWRLADPAKRRKSSDTTQTYPVRPSHVGAPDCPWLPCSITLPRPDGPSGLIDHNQGSLSELLVKLRTDRSGGAARGVRPNKPEGAETDRREPCLLYTSDAADE